MKRVAPFLTVLVCLLGLLAYGRDCLDRWVDQTVIPPVLAEVSIEVHARDGTLLRAFPVEDGRMRLALHLNEVDPQFLDMLISYEDKRFYQHGGVDIRAMIRAVFLAGWHGRVVTGGSTLTMQVARLLENSGTGSMKGKLRQMRLAMALERHLTKSEILTLYLHHAPYGGPVEGVRAASLAWFGKEPDRLTQAQAALLVALPQSPEGRRPDRHPEAARKARERVLERLQLEPVVGQADVPKTLQVMRQDAPHLAAHLRQKSPETLRHITTIDGALQRRIQALAKRAVAGQPRGVSAAVLIANHETGEILAHVGSPAFSDTNGMLGFVDMTAAIRSPGSTLKPLVYGLAFGDGVAHPSTLIDDAPININGYAPQNFDGTYRGMLTARDALTLSLNIPPVLLTQRLGPARLVSGLRRAGIKPQLRTGKAGLAVSLGGVGMSLRDLTQLYAGIAQGGKAPRLHTQKHISASQPKRFLPHRAAWQVAHILSGITAPRGFDNGGGKVAYKTGTSYGHRDAWAIGFDGRHVVGVWLGRPDGTPVPGAFGGALAAPILFEAFGRIGPERKPLAGPPDGAIILGTAQLPDPLKQFLPRDAIFNQDPQRPVVTFPPQGAILRRSGFGVPLKLQAGTLPLTVLVDGLPVLKQLRDRSAVLPLREQGFRQISVVDALGRSASVEIRLD